jgi:hypothetical protein
VRTVPLYPEILHIYEFQSLVLEILQLGDGYCTGVWQVVHYMVVVNCGVSMLRVLLRV